MKNLTIENKLDLFNILYEQFGSIIIYEGILIISAFLVDRELILILQLILIPIFVLYLIAKFNKPVLYLEIDLKNENYIFGIAQFGKKVKKIIIPVKDIRIIERWKCLMRFNTNVVEIKDKNKTKIVIPKKEINKQFIERLHELIESLS